jgi:hypothetical protein
MLPLRHLSRIRSSVSTTSLSPIRYSQMHIVRATVILGLPVNRHHSSRMVRRACMNAVPGARPSPPPA